MCRADVITQAYIDRFLEDVRFNANQYRYCLSPQERLEGFNYVTESLKEALMMSKGCDKEIREILTEFIKRVFNTTDIMEAYQKANNMEEIVF